MENVSTPEKKSFAGKHDLWKKSRIEAGSLLFGIGSGGLSYVILQSLAFLNPVMALTLGIGAAIAGHQIFRNNHYN